MNMAQIEGNVFRTTWSDWWICTLVP